MRATALTIRILVPPIWLGMLLGLSFIETPLKFLAPGIDLPIGLGLGRIVFNAMNLAAVVLLVLLLLSVLVSEATRALRSTVIILGVVLAVQIALVRPFLNARSDAIIAGNDPGESMLHYVYIAFDLLVLALLIAVIVQVLRPVLRTATTSQES